VLGLQRAPSTFFRGLKQEKMSLSLEEARKAMIAKRFGGNPQGARTGGAGTQRNKSKGGAARSGGEDKKLGTVLKKLGVQPLNGVEEVNIFKNDGNVIHITSPKIQASVPSNTYAVSGDVSEKSVASFLPGILSQLGSESIDRLKEYVTKEQAAAGAPTNDDDDDVPELVENFEEAAKSE
jgi:nascent polypeptide-associated complex subunit beta